jgi:hypothetical protein
MASRPIRRATRQAGGCASKISSPSANVIHGCLLRVQMCRVGRSHDVSSRLPARMRTTPSLGGPQIEEPHSGHTSRVLTRPLSATRCRGLGSTPLRRKAVSATTSPIEKALPVNRWQAVPSHPTRVLAPPEACSARQGRSRSRPYGTGLLPPCMARFRRGPHGYGRRDTGPRRQPHHGPQAFFVGAARDANRGFANGYVARYYATNGVPALAKNVRLATLATVRQEAKQLPPNPYTAETVVYVQYAPDIETQ